MAGDAHPRWMTDAQMMEAFGLSQRALSALRSNPKFPTRDALLNKTDSKAVDAFFDKRSGLSLHPSSHGPFAHDGEENFAA